MYINACSLNSKLSDTFNLKYDFERKDFLSVYLLYFIFFK